ncbi:MAG: HNH endonuclease signature motif containing protein [Pyrinomonadaceae bacterium]
MNPNHFFVSHRAGERCEYCMTPESTSGFPFEIDHFVPTSRGGSEDVENLVLACRSCNVFKTYHLFGVLTDSADTRLYNPRSDSWDDHFRFDTVTAEIMGLTRIGIGTVNRLKMNSVFQVRARCYWLKTHPR